MNVTEIAPSTALDQFKNTKILATIGPATDSYESILAMMKAGVNGFRLNFSHGDYEERKTQINWIRKASKEYGKPVAIVQDLQGPKIRLGDFEGVVAVNKGQELVLGYDIEYKLGGALPVQYDLSKKVKRGETVLLYDGKIRGTVTSVRQGAKEISVRIANDGVLVKRKGINLPDTDFAGDIITKKDRQDIVFGAGEDIDFVALSFVQTADDIKELRRLLKNLGSQARVITKVETKAALLNLEEIVQASDGVMVARGDLATETMPESVPVWQREIIRLCLQYGKISIVATQMLASMMEQPEPTRAEVSDVATAVIVGADAVMLSDETAVGRYPVEAINIMKRIILYTQENATVSAKFTVDHAYTLSEAIAASIIELANQVKAVAVVAETKTGTTALDIAGWRPKMPIIVVTSENRVAQQLALLYGAKTYVRPDDKLAATKLTDWLRAKSIFKKNDIVVIVSGRYPGTPGGTDTIKVRVLEQIMTNAYKFPKKTIRDISVHGKRILVRADLNVPLNEKGAITSDFRIIESLPTLKYLLERNCTVFVIAHLGRPEGHTNKTFSLKPVAAELKKLLPEYPIEFVGSTVDDKARQACKVVKPGTLALLENLRFNSGEEANDPEFAAQIQKTVKADYFVQDGFGVVHRAHASTEAITHLVPSIAGLLLEKEVSVLQTAMQHPHHPLVAVVGGAKISDKIGFIEKLLGLADTIAIGGAMANTFLKYQGYEIGKSKYEEGQESEIATILQKAKTNQIVLPVDVVVSKEIAKDSQIVERHIDSVKDDEYILDLGSETMNQFDSILQTAATVIWNGTLGFAEIPQFAKASSSLASDIALKHQGITSIIGGGDTADFALEWLESNQKGHFTHISTGGGASLELMSGMKLPGVEALIPQS